MTISIVIPAYNEEKRIGLTLDSIFSYISKNKDIIEILIVLNNCTDDTIGVVYKYTLLDNRFKYIDCGILENKKVSNTKGYAIKVGLKESIGDYVLFMDADSSTDISELNKFIPFLKNGYDCVIGSRYLPDSVISIKQSVFRIFASRAGNLLIRLLILPNIKDTQCGFKIFKREVINRVYNDLKIDGFSFDIEILYLIKKYGFKIKEIGIYWKNMNHSTVTLKHFLITFKDLILIYLRK